MNINELQIDEAKMNPTSFANAIKSGEEQGVQVGFEFEVCVPEKTIKTTKKDNLYYIEKIQDVFNSDVDFMSLGYSQSYGGDVISPRFMDSCLRPRPDTKPTYPTFAEAARSIPRSQRDFKDDYSDVVKAMFSDHGRISFNYLERHLDEYFEFINPQKLYNKLVSLDIISDGDYDHDNDYQGAARILKSAVEKTFNVPVVVFNDYHQHPKNFSNWYIEPDGSLEPNTYRDGSAEIVSPPLPANEAMEALKKFYAMAKQLNLYTGEDNFTGLHINVSIPKTLDVFKLAVFLGDEYALRTFGREDNEYAWSVIKALKDRESSDIYKTKTDRRRKNKPMPGRPITTSTIDYNKLKQIIGYVTDAHSASISNNGKYISFRQAGGDYLNNYQDVVNIVGRFVQAMIIASDPEAYRQEYLKKLTKVFGTPKVPISQKLTDIQNTKAIIQKIKTIGVPVLEISMSTKKSRTNWQNREYDALNLQALSLGRILGYFNIEHSIIEKNSEQAKQNIVKLFRGNERAGLNALDSSHFAKSTILPFADNLERYYKSKEDGEKLIYDEGKPKWVDNDTGVNVISLKMLPFTDPLAQQVYKELLKKINIKESVEYPENPIYYFAYGMLTDPEKMGGLDLVGVAELRNFKYEMYQFANVEPESGSTVYGCLWEVDREIISHLDRVEGYPELYDRRTYPVYIDNEKFVAEVYVMTPSTLRYVQGTFPTQEYISSVARGYLHAGIPTDQLKNALIDAKGRKDEQQYRRY